MVFEYCTFNRIEDFMYIYGGKDFNRNNLVGCYNIKTKKWKHIICKKSFPPHGRISHSCITFQKKLYYFGGEKKYSEKEHHRQCFNDVWAFDTVTETWNE